MRAMEQRVLKVRLVQQVLREHKDLPVGCRDRRAMRASKVFLVARKAGRDHRVATACRVHKDSKEIKGTKVSRETLVFRVCKGMWGGKELKGIKETRDSKGWVFKVLRGARERLDSKVLEDSREIRGIKDFKDGRAFKGLADSKELKEIRDWLDYRDFKEHKEIRVL